MTVDCFSCADVLLRLAHSLMLTGTGISNISFYEFPLLTAHTDRQLHVGLVLSSSKFSLCATMYCQLQPSNLKMGLPSIHELQCIIHAWPLWGLATLTFDTLTSTCLAHVMSNLCSKICTSCGSPFLRWAQEWNGQTGRQQRSVPDHWITMSTYVFYGLVDSPEHRPLVNVESSATAMKHWDAMALGWLTVAHVHAVVRPIIPVTRVLIQLVYNTWHVRIWLINSCMTSLQPTVHISDGIFSWNQNWNQTVWWLLHCSACWKCT